MKIQVLPDADAVALEAAKFIAAEARTAVKARGRFSIAVSGGHTPWQMLRALAGQAGGRGRPFYTSFKWMNASRLPAIRIAT